MTERSSLPDAVRKILHQSLKMKCMFQVYLSYSISMPEERIKTLVVLFSEERVREGVEWVQNATCER